MATIDYKEKYEQALERARQFSEKPYLEDSAGIVEYIFPELKESKGELIRKEMIEVIRKEAKEFPSSIIASKAGSWLSWLEKQSEQKPNPVLDIEIPFGAKDSELQEASYHIPEGFHAEINGNRVVIKRGEQKPVEWSQEDLICLGYLADFVDKNGDAFYGKNKPNVVKWVRSFSELPIHEHINDIEQKPSVWSEEDERLMGELIDLIFKAPYCDKRYKLSNWLKSLKDRCIPQPKQEWSKDDDDMLNTIIADYKFLSKKYRDKERDFFITMQLTGDDIEAVSWLESLKNRVLSQSKKEWNKEDERNINDVRSIIYENCRAEDASRLIEWFLSLRPQPKQEWNDEDKRMLESVINDIKSLKQQVYCKSACDKEIDWLKSLNPQSRWKPSESDILLLERIANGKSNPQDFQASLGGLIGQLKILREE